MLQTLFEIHVRRPGRTVIRLSVLRHESMAPDELAEALVDYARDYARARFGPSARPSFVNGLVTRPADSPVWEDLISLGKKLGDGKVRVIQRDAGNPDRKWRVVGDEG